MRRFRCERKGCKHKDYNIGGGNFCLIPGPPEQVRPCPPPETSMESVAKRKRDLYETWKIITGKSRADYSKLTEKKPQTRKCKMCYDMRCRYQNYEGDCTIGSRRYPEDAACQIVEESENVEETNEEEDE